MAKLAECEYFLVPVRPSGKSDFPHQSLADYASVRREDGLLADPWLRTHERLGARILWPMEGCQIFEGPVDEWIKSTALDIAASGSYIVPKGLSPLHVDMDTGLGMSHPME